jgi:SecD/SecF fusion protein
MQPVHGSGQQLTERSYKDTMPIAITLDDVVYSAPIAHKGKITGGRTEISGDLYR